MITITGEPSRLHCFGCGKFVSSTYVPIPTDTPDRGLYLRAVVTCPECLAAAQYRGEKGEGLEAARERHRWIVEQLRLEAGVLDPPSMRAHLSGDLHRAAADAIASLWAHVHRRADSSESEEG